MKKFIIFLITIILVTVVALLLITRNTNSTHTGIISSNLPPLIPTRAFYASTLYESNYIVSNNGELLAVEKASFTGLKIMIKNVSTGEYIADFPIDIKYIRWHPSKPLLRFIYDGYDWEADPYAPEKENWKNISPIKLSGGWNKNQLPTNDDMRITVWGSERNTEPGHTWLVSQDGLEAEKIALGNSKTNYWVFDRKNKPILRVDSLNASTERMFRKENDKWVNLIDIKLEDDFSPIFDVKENGTVLARSARGRDKAALVSFDIMTGNETVIVDNPNADIGWTRSLSNSGKPDLIRLGIDTLEYAALTDTGQVFLDILSEFPQPITLGKTSTTASGRHVAQTISIQSKSYIFLLIDLEKKGYKVLDEFHFTRFKDHLVQEQAVTFTARDGLEIPAILTLPKGIKEPIPFIVHIHGGPALNSEIGYNHDIQFLVNRGYGVLSVNFRGSKGFGKSFQAKGFKEFGRGMQNDIVDAAYWLINNNLADPDALVAMGMSYGGYSAALAMTQDPDLFDAAIVEFPMLDVEFQSKYHPGFWQSKIDGWWRYFGNTNNPEELELMQKYSPTNRVDQLHGPILMLGGLRDQTTVVQQAKDFEAKAIKKGKSIEAYYFPNARHGVHKWQDKLLRARRIEDFLAEHVGGRSGGFELIQYLANYTE